MSLLSLPQIDLEFEEEVRVGQLLVLGGRMPDAAWLRRAASGRAVWAVDRGAEFCRAAGVEPARALGDFDSIGGGGQEWLERLGVETDRYPADKDYTDFQLALRQAAFRQAAPGQAGADLLVTGCWGGRFDHAFANVFSALWGREWGANVRAFADESEVLVPLFARARLALRFRTPPLAVSLLPLTSVCRAGVRGTKWELPNDTALSQGRPYAISNVPASDEVVVEACEGTIGIYCFFSQGP
jgi:thiamine pyrophosphokinase